jgi:hypothetical protein
VPLHLSPEITPVQRPEPEFPTSRPEPLACDAPSEALTDTAPAGLTLPLTLPPPADEIRVPDTLNGALLLLQLPALVVKVTFQVPSKLPARGAALTGLDITPTAIKAARASPVAVRDLKFENDVIDGDAMLMMSCRFADACTGVPLT